MASVPSNAPAGREARQRIIPVSGEMRPPRPFESQLHRIRLAANASVALALIVLAGFCMTPIEDNYSASGVVWPAEYQDLYAGADCLTSTTLVRANDVAEPGQVLMTFRLPEMENQVQDLEGQEAVLAAKFELERAHTAVKRVQPLPQEFWELSQQIEKSAASVAYYESQLHRQTETAKAGGASARDVEAAQLQYDQAKIEHQRLESRLGLVNKEGLGKVLLAEAEAGELVLQRDLERTRAQLAAQRERLAELSVLRAPVRGTILELYNEHPGQQCRRGDLLVYMALADQRIVEIAGDQHNFHRVVIGQKVRFKSDTYDAFKYGYAQGHVIKISPIRSSVTLGGQSRSSGEAGGPGGSGGGQAAGAASGGELRYMIKAAIDSEPMPLKLTSTVQAEIVLRKDRLYKVVLGLDKVDK
jgi:multidrug resistance efflux pump